MVKDTQFSDVLSLVKPLAHNYWASKALADYRNNIAYLIREGGDTPAKRLIDNVEIALDLISRFPRLYPFIGLNKIQKAVVNQNITLYFEIRGNETRIYRLWNSRQDPKNLKF